MATARRAPKAAYVYGNTAPAVQPMHRQPEKPQTTHRHAVSYTVRRNQEKALHMNLPYVIMLTMAAVCVLSICVNYLHVQSSITSRIYNIEKLEREIEQLKAENDALSVRINTGVDLNYVYKVATEELGMVYANRDQVLLYDRTESEYVRQYEDIPKH